MERILMIRLRELGDTLLATPLFRQLRRLYPDAQIDLVCQKQNQQIVAHNPHIDETFCLERKLKPSQFLKFAFGLRARKYSMAIDLQNMPKTAMLTRLTGAPVRIGYYNRWLRNRLCYTRPVPPPEILNYSATANLDLLEDPRVDPNDVALDYYTSPADQAEAEQFCHQHFRGKTAALSVAGNYSCRCWPPEQLAALGDRLAMQGWEVFFVYGPGQEKQANAVAKRMKSSPIVGYPMIRLGVLYGVLERCGLFVGNDGGPHHMAVAAKVPSVALFPMNPARWTAPNNPLHRFIAPVSRTAPTDAHGVFDGETFAQIPLDTVWEQVQICLQSGVKQAS